MAHLSTLHTQEFAWRLTAHGMSAQPTAKFQSTELNFSHFCLESLIKLWCLFLACVDGSPVSFAHNAQRVDMATLVVTQIIRVYTRVIAHTSTILVSESIRW